MKKRALPSSLKKLAYKDFDLSFKRHPVTGKLLIKKDDEAVKQAVKNVVLTNRFERPFHPEFGGDVRASLFENFTSFSQAELSEKIARSVENYESRVQLVADATYGPVTVQEYPDQNGMAVTIRFRNVATLNEVTLDINLNKVR
jgi:phage baseplate assembly protein W